MEAEVEGWKVEGGCRCGMWMLLLTRNQNLAGLFCDNEVARDFSYERSWWEVTSHTPSPPACIGQSGWPIPATRVLEAVDTSRAGISCLKVLV